MIIGYKCFKKGLINNYNEKFELGKIYSVTGPIKAGVHGNGYHICTNIEDTFRYIDNKNGIDVCLVCGFGDKDLLEDEYNGYYDMYAVEKFMILKILSREEIINIWLNLVEYRLLRFIEGYKLLESEKNIFKQKYKNQEWIMNAIAYYQDNDLEIYQRKLDNK